MLREYAVDPQAIGSNWQTFRYLIEKFGFDRGRLISQFPKHWLREVYTASVGFTELQRKRVEVLLTHAKKYKVVRFARDYDPQLGGWLDNALAQHATIPFHAIISETKPARHDAVLLADEVDDLHPLMDAPHTWLVPRVGEIARAMAPMLIAARTLLFVDRYFDISSRRYQDTLKECLDVVQLGGSGLLQCEIHYYEDDRKPTVAYIEQNARRWLRGVIPRGMTVALYRWQEKENGEDFHARDLLTEFGGINVESGFSAEGEQQSVRLTLLSFDIAQSKLEELRREATVYELVEPVLVIAADGTVRRA